MAAALRARHFHVSVLCAGALDSAAGFWHALLRSVGSGADDLVSQLRRSGIAAHCRSIRRIGHHLCRARARFRLYCPRAVDAGHP